MTFQELDDKIYKIIGSVIFYTALFVGLTIALSFAGITFIFYLGVCAGIIISTIIYIAGRRRS